MLRFCLQIILLMVATMQPVLAADIQIDKYYAAKCQDYAGTWKGMITDPTDLFADGGPWPVTIVLSVKGKEVVGESSAFIYSGGKSGFDSRMIHARCENGQLQDIFWGQLNACGSLSQTGVLVSKKMLVLQLNYENAMIGANMLAFLQRKSDESFIPKAKQLELYDPGQVKSCQ